MPNESIKCDNNSIINFTKFILPSFNLDLIILNKLSKPLIKILLFDFSSNLCKNSIASFLSLHLPLSISFNN